MVEDLMKTKALEPVGELEPSNKRGGRGDGPLWPE
jgi:hypothetical protein